MCLSSFKMPVVFGRFENSLRGQFETSLRGQDSPRPDKKLHKGCSGHSHGNSVKKERPSRTLPVSSKDCCYHDGGSSSDESNHPRRSQSSEYTRLLTPVTRRSTSASNSAVAQRLFTSPTKAVTAKYRAERTASDGVKMAAAMKAIKGYNSNSLPRRGRANKSAEEDSGNFSSSEENTDGRFVDLVTPTPVKQNLIHGTSDDELSIQELRRKQRQQRRDYLHLKNSGQSGSRRQSPSPVKRDLQCNESRGRKSSDDASDSSYSPPASPLMTFRSSSSNKIWQRSPANLGFKPRARSSGVSTNSCAYAFGSSTKRFVDDTAKKLPSPLHKSSSDGVQNGLKAAELALRRTYSDPRQREKQEITKAWLKFKEDIEAAMQKKPNTGGYYKNLADMMTTKMEMLADEVGLLLTRFSICPGSGFLENFLDIALLNLR